MDFIKKFDLSPHPEGGYFKQTYHSKETINTINGTRYLSTAIIFLLTNESHSNLHRLKSDEMWHFYQGDDINIVEIDSNNGNLNEICLNSDNPQYLVKNGNWFGSYIKNPIKKYSLVGCTVTPGFEYDDFELGDRNELLKQYAKDNKLEKLIKFLT